MCAFFNTEPEKIFPFGGKRDHFSNHYEEEFEFSHVKPKTSESHWFSQKAMSNVQDILALECLNAQSGKEAKTLGASIRCSADWDKHGEGRELMKDILKAKGENVPKVKECLEFCWHYDLHIVEAVPNFRDRFWGSALDKNSTKNTAPDA